MARGEEEEATIDCDDDGEERDNFELVEMVSLKWPLS